MNRNILLFQKIILFLAPKPRLRKKKREKKGKKRKKSHRCVQNQKKNSITHRAASCIMRRPTISRTTSCVACHPTSEWCYRCRTKITCFAWSVLFQWTHILIRPSADRLSSDRLLSDRWPRSSRRSALMKPTRIDSRSAPLAWTGCACMTSCSLTKTLATSPYFALACNRTQSACFYDESLSPHQF